MRPWQGRPAVASRIGLRASTTCGFRVRLAGQRGYSLWIRERGVVTIRDEPEPRASGGGSRRHPEIVLTAASSRTWRGSGVSAAPAPAGRRVSG